MNDKVLLAVAMEAFLRGFRNAMLVQSRLGHDIQSYSPDAVRELFMSEVFTGHEVGCDCDKSKEKIN